MMTAFSRERGVRRVKLQEPVHTVLGAQFGASSGIILALMTGGRREAQLGEEYELVVHQGAGDRVRQLVSRS